MPALGVEPCSLQVGLAGDCRMRSPLKAQGGLRRMQLAQTLQASSAQVEQAHQRAESARQRAESSEQALQRLHEQAAAADRECVAADARARELVSEREGWLAQLQVRAGPLKWRVLLRLAIMRPLPTMRTAHGSPLGSISTVKMESIVL